jgi:ribokinase
VQRALDLKLSISLNPSPLRGYFTDLWRLVATAFVNEGEAAALGGVASLRAAGVSRGVLTLGPAGALLVDGAGETEVPARPAQMLDATGAGDCFMGVALASAALRAVQLDTRALRHASVAAALTVTRPGTVSAFPTEQELQAILTTA